MELAKKKESTKIPVVSSEEDDLGLLDLTVNMTISEVPIRTRLGQLWARASEMFVATTDLQIQLLNENYDADMSITAITAFSRYAKLLLEYEKESQVLGVFEKMHREKNVTLHLDRIEVEGENIYPKGGSFEEEDFFSNMCREISNIVISNTRITSEKVIISSCTPADVRVARFPFVDTVRLRKLFRNFEPDFTKARDAVFNLLKNWKNPMYIINIASYLLQEESLSSVRVKVDPNSALYAKYISAKKNYFLNVETVYVFKRSAPSLLGFPNPDDAWRYRDVIVKLRGDERKQGNLTSGYYRYDLTPSVNRVVEEVADILFLCRSVRMRAVRLEKTNYELARLLIMNQITVYAPSMSTVMEPDPIHESKSTGTGKKKKNVITTAYAPPGLYYEGPQIHFTYIGFASSMPSVTKEAVKYPVGMVLRKERLMVAVEPIPKSYDPLYRYLPSSRVDKGYCLKTNMTSFANVPIDVLSKRFSAAVRYRSWYIYTRIPYSSQDPFRNNFNYPIYLPKVRKEVTKLDFSKAIEQEVAANIIAFTEDMMVESLTKLQFEAKPVQKAEPLVDKAAIDDVLTAVKDLSAREIHKVLEKMRNGKVAGTAYEALLPMGQSEMIQAVSSIYAEVASREQRELRQQQQFDQGRQEADQDQGAPSDEEGQASMLDMSAMTGPVDVDEDVDRDAGLQDLNEGFATLLGSIVQNFVDE